MIENSILLVPRLMKNASAVRDITGRHQNVAIGAGLRSLPL